MPTDAVRKSRKRNKPITILVNEETIELIERKNEILNYQIKLRRKAE